MDKAKKIRLFELLLVIVVAFAQSIFYSTYVVFNGEGPPDQESLNLRFISGIILELSAIAVLVYVLFRQGRTLRTFGLTFSWKDIPMSLLLMLAAYVLTLILRLGLSMIYYFATRKTLDSTPQNIESFKANFSIFYLLFIFINPFFEEIIARAYVMSEVKELFGKTSLAIIASVVLQTSYHLYQGWSSAIILFSGFLIFSLYYSESRRITPVILAHFYLDLLAFLTYVKNLN